MAIIKMIENVKNFITGAWSLVKGLAVTLKNCFIPAITLQYPTQKQSMQERFRGLVDLHPEKCITCNQCIKICPTACLSLTYKEVDTSTSLGTSKKKIPETFKYNMELCCFCGLCQQVCPTSAIYMNKLYEIAVYDRDKLQINLLNPEKYIEWTDTTIK